MIIIYGIIRNTRKTKNEGTQDKMDEKLRAEIQKLMDSRKEEREKKIKY